VGVNSGPAWRSDPILDLALHSQLPTLNSIMHITLNGERRELSAPQTLTELLGALGFGGKPVVVELNREAIFPRDYGQTTVNDGDQLELVTLAAGG